MQKFDDLSRSLTTLEPGGTLIAVIEMSLSSWLVAGIVPGVERQRLKKLAIDESAFAETAASMAGGSEESRMAAYNQFVFAKWVDFTAPFLRVVG